MLVCIGGLLGLSVFNSPINMTGGVSGATLYVNTTGSGGAYISIQDAVDAANPGDTVFVYSGTYVENVVVDKTINLTGEDRNTTIIDGGGSGNVIWCPADWVNISGFKITNGDLGIYMSSNQTIYNNHISSNGQDVSCGGSVENNIIKNNHIGRSSFVFASNNTVVGNDLEHLSIQNSIFNKIINNTISSSPDNGLSILYSSNYNTIDGNVFSDCDEAIYIRESRYNNITNNIMSSTQYYGVSVQESSYNTIKNNSITHTWWGIYLKASSENNSVSCNEIHNTDNGIHLGPNSNNEIISNNISNNQVGIYLYKTSNITITMNTISHNDYGIIVYSASNNSIYHNNILNNIMQAQDNNYTNRWDNGYPSGGNFWSDYNGSDFFSGPDQDIQGYDGIGDTNYSIDTDSFDNYPLMEPIPDTLPPRIYLISPANNSFIQQETIIDFYVYDGNLDFANYSIDGGLEQSFTYPFNVSTSGWLDKDYNIQINARDFAGNSNVSWYLFTIDSTNPSIHLNSPENNSIVPSGILLNFSVIDLNLFQVNFSVNGGFDTLLSNPFDIDTTGWSDGDYTIQINALDLAGNSNSSGYFFTIDSTKPTIICNSPGNNTIITNETILDFLVIDPYLTQVNYSINNGTDTTFFTPFNISIFGWPEGDYMIQINAQDLVGNHNTSWYLFTIDSTLPIIQLNSPRNSSNIYNGIVLDFSVNDTNLQQVTYSVNGGVYLPLIDPFDILTSGWLDNDYSIQINAQDMAGNSNSSWYDFTIDSTKPEIFLNTPDNNSFISNYTILDFSISDLHLAHVNYSVNGGVTIPLSEPYEISCSNWTDGDYMVQINALDLAGNLNYSWYSFTKDTNKPEIILNSPFNESIFHHGTVLDFSVNDVNLLHANYSVNGDTSIPFFEPYHIYSWGWPDGDYTVTVSAIDTFLNTTTSWYFFSVDSTKPEISLEYPPIDSVIQSGTVLNFNISEPHLKDVTYSVNGGADIPLIGSQYISTTGWEDGNSTIQINANDYAGNSNSSLFYFTIDSSPPSIRFDSSLNHSTIVEGITIPFYISDPHLSSVMYLIDSGEYNDFTTQYLIDTSGLSAGSHFIEVKANDTPGNEAKIRLYINIKSTPDIEPPWVISTTPVSGSLDIDINTTVIITFSEPMNLTGAENFISISPSSDFEFVWDENGTILSLLFETNNLEEATLYTITIDSQITDVSENPIGSDFAMTFTTVSPPPLDTDGDGALDIEDLDDDNDGYPDTEDAFPLDSAEWADFDTDGIGDNADPDDDNDLVFDDKDDFPFDPDRWKESEEGDFLLYILIIIVIVIISVTLLTLLIRRKKLKPEPPRKVMAAKEPEPPSQDIIEEPPPEAPKPLPPPPPPPPK